MKKLPKGRTGKYTIYYGDCDEQPIHKMLIDPPLKAVSLEVHDRLTTQVMNLDDAIDHAWEKSNYGVPMTICQENHLQLYVWLTLLKHYLERGHEDEAKGAANQDDKRAP